MGFLPVILMGVYRCNTITGILLRCGPVQFGPVLHARLYLVLYYSTRTVTVQLPMHVLHSICYGYTYSDDDQSSNVVYRN